MLWLLPLVAIFLETGDKRMGTLRLPKIDLWTGWWLFCGLVGLIYFAFIPGLPIPLLVLGDLAEFVPLYIFISLAVRNSSWKNSSDFPFT